LFVKKLLTKEVRQGTVNFRHHVERIYTLPTRLQYEQEGHKQSSPALSGLLALFTFFNILS